MGVFKYQNCLPEATFQRFHCQMLTLSPPKATIVAIENSAVQTQTPPELGLHFFL